MGVQIPPRAREEKGQVIETWPFFVAGGAVLAAPGTDDHGGEVEFGGDRVGVRADDPLGAGVVGGRDQHPRGVLPGAPLGGDRRAGVVVDEVRVLVREHRDQLPQDEGAVELDEPVSPFVLTVSLRAEVDPRDADALRRAEVGQPREALLVHR
ncbi:MULTISPECIES: hypothetical protein [unclassified Nocardioides]|uniref:hypothetical protein n=1 Tax=unclassified Nocardioides TaxID=2615069 RepID=UPI0009E7A708|nr:MULTISPECIES: hypothetical protein [unclassified Nocardioides]